MKKSQQWVLLIFVFGLLSGCLGENQNPQSPSSEDGETVVECSPGQMTESITVAGQERTYISFAPSCEKQKSPIPLVMMFHGFSSSAEAQIAFTALELLAESKGFFLLFMESGNLGTRQMAKGWQLTKTQDNLDLTYVDAVLKQMLGRYQINAQRVYALGHSNGAQFVYRLAELRSRTFAALGAFGGSSFNNIVLNQTGGVLLPSTRAVPLAFVVGSKNEVISANTSLDPSFKALAVGSGAKDAAVRSYGCRAAKDNGSYIQYLQCANESEVLWYMVPGMTHMQWASPLSSQYPTRPEPPVDANELIWEFFSRHQLK